MACVRPSGVFLIVCGPSRSGKSSAARKELENSSLPVRWTFDVLEASYRLHQLRGPDGCLTCNVVLETNRGIGTIPAAMRIQADLVVSLT